MLPWVNVSSASEQGLQSKCVNERLCLSYSLPCTQQTVVLYQRSEFLGLEDSHSDLQTGAASKPAVAASVPRYASLCTAIVAAGSDHVWTGSLLSCQGRYTDLGMLPEAKTTAPLPPQSHAVLAGTSPHACCPVSDS